MRKEENVCNSLTFATIEEDSSRAQIKGFMCRHLLELWFNLKRVTRLLWLRLDSVSLWWQCDGRSGRTLTGKDQAIELSTVSDMKSSLIPASASFPTLVAEQPKAAAVKSMTQLLRPLEISLLTLVFNLVSETQSPTPLQVCQHSSQTHLFFKFQKFRQDPAQVHVSNNLIAQIWTILSQSRLSSQVS